MRLREVLNRKPVISASIVTVVIIAAGSFVWSAVMKDPGPKPVTMAFYSTDDGATWFSDDASKLTPFEADGKQACRVHLFQCGNEPPFVAYLERYTVKGKALMEEYRVEQDAEPNRRPRSAGALRALGMAAKEVKRPGDQGWVNMTEGGMGLASNVRCKDKDRITEITP